jgi:hypothetical protein
VIDPAPVEPPPIPRGGRAPADAIGDGAGARGPADANRTEPKTDARPDTPEPEPSCRPRRFRLPFGRGRASGPEAERQVRDTINRANKLLETVDARGLGDDRKATHDSAKDSILRAEDALKASNMVLARSRRRTGRNLRQAGQWAPNS